LIKVPRRRPSLGETGCQPGQGGEEQGDLNSPSACVRVMQITLDMA
jgi:hypothetical protein